MKRIFILPLTSGYKAGVDSSNPSGRTKNLYFNKQPKIMPGLKNISLSTLKLPSKSSLGASSNRAKPGISSIAHQNRSASSFHQFGDTVSHTQNNERSGKIFGSISRAIKNKNNPEQPHNTTPLNQNFKTKI